MPFLSHHKKTIFSLLLVFFIAGGFFIFSINKLALADAKSDQLKQAYTQAQNEENIAKTNYERNTADPELRNALIAAQQKTKAALKAFNDYDKTLKTQATTDVSTAQNKLNAAQAKVDQEPSPENEAALAAAQKEYDAAKANYNQNDIEYRSAQTNASKEPTLTWWEKAIRFLLSIIANIVLFIFWGLLWLAGQILDGVISIQKYDVPIVTKGWEITRGLCNMFFALALLIMAFATILRIEKYGMKEYLWKIVVAALLINFSLVIGGIFIDVAQVFTNYFLEASKGTSSLGISGQLMNGLRVTNIFPQGGNVGIQITTAVGGLFTYLASIFFSAIILLIAAFTLFAAAFFFLIRIPVIWLLLIFSPFAWLSWALPGKAGSLWDKWWQNFLKWVFFAPIYTFFIYLAVFAAGNNQQGGENSFDTLFADVTQKINSGQSGILSGMLEGSIHMLMQYIIIIIILLGGLFVAQSFGIYGAKGIMGAAKSVGKFATSGIGGFVQRKLQAGAKDEREGWRRGGWRGKMRRAGAYLAPDTWKEGWKKRREQKEREARGVATGTAQDFFNRALSFGKEKTDYRERAQRARIAEEEKDILSDNAEELVAGFEKAKEIGNYEKMGAYLKKLTRPNDQNELLRYYNKTHGTDYTEDATGMAQFVKQQLVPKMGEQQAYRLGHDVNRIMESNGQWTGRGFSVDPKTGKYSLTQIDIESAIDAKIDFEGLDEKGVTNKLAETNNLLRKLLESGKKRGEWTDDEKKAERAYSIRASALADVEWSKQDPQIQARNTGRMSYIQETYDETGQTIDNGLTPSGLKKISIISSAHASRFNAHARALLMVNHADEVDGVNTALHNAFMDDYVKQTNGMNQAQLDNFYKQIGTFAPSVRGIDDETRMAKFKKSIETHRSGGAVKKRPESKPVGKVEMENPDLNK